MKHRNSSHDNTDMGDYGMFWYHFLQFFKKFFFFFFDSDFLAPAKWSINIYYLLSDVKLERRRKLISKLKRFIGAK